MIRALTGILLTLGAAAIASHVRAEPVECRNQVHSGAGFTLCEVDMRKADLRLFLRDDAGRILGQFGRVDAALRRQGQRLVFAMNAGMYHDDRRPVGHYVENGAEEQGLITRAGPGNFGMLPNGLLCIRDGRAEVIETLRYAGSPRDCRHATQSGPMLVIDGALHPRFLPDGTSRYVRNGVGTSADGTRAVFAISNVPVNFHTFGTLFRDALELPNALYFDGNVSRLYAPAIGRSDAGFSLGPIVGVAAPDPASD